MREQIKALFNLSVNDYLEQHLFQNPKYENPKRLNRHEFQSFSQNGEDGIIEEIFTRIGTTNKFFVEFGIGKDGMENNTIQLLLQNWSGAWMEGNPKTEQRVRNCYQREFAANKLRFKNAYITAENVEQLFTDLAVPKEFDFLSLDIDGNDYWVWKALKTYQPRVVCIEYNATFGAKTKWVMSYDPKFIWPGETSYCGASLKSLELLGAEKGYKLVGCNFTGANAFFVRNDCAGNKFLEPYTSETHFEPSRGYLLFKNGKPRVWGKFESI